MKIFIVLFCALCASAVAQNYNAAIQQAHNAVNQTEAASQGHQQPMMPQPPQAQKPVASNPALAATLQNISCLRADLDGLSANFTPKSLTNDLASAANEKKASTATVAILAGDLQAAITGNEKLNLQHEKLAQDIHAIFNSSQLSPSQQQTIESDAQKILRTGGVPSDKISDVTDDLKAVADETK